MKKEVRQFLLPLITALYIVLVPLLGLFFRKRVRPVVWCSCPENRHRKRERRYLHDSSSL